MKIDIQHENLFENIDTEEKAYWLGLLMADGSIAWHQTKTKGLQVYGIKLGLCDLDVMRKFIQFIGFPDDFKFQIQNNPPCKPVYYVYVSSGKMARDLGKYGMIPNKTHRTEISNNIPDNLIRHFIRGYFDGDGCLYIRESKRKNNTKRKEKGIIITSCSIKILQQIEQILKKYNIIKLNKNYIRFPKEYNGKKHPPYLVITHRMNVHNFLNFIYDNSFIYIDRKYNLYLTIKNDLLPQKRSNQKYYGVTFVPKNINKPYLCRFTYNGIKYRIGTFNTEKEAALAFNNKIKELNLPETMLNKIEEVTYSAQPQ